MERIREKELRDLIHSLSTVLYNYDDIGMGKAVNPIDAFFAFRILFNRNPNLYIELPRIIDSKQTYRTYLSTLLNSEEFSRQPMFVPPNRVWMAEVDNFRFWFNTSDREMGVRMALNAFEPESVALLKKFLKKGMKCIDAGANTGFYSCIMASIVGEHGKVYAFEPMPSNFQMLQRNVSENRFDSIVDCHNIACSDIQGTIEGTMVSNMYVVGDIDGGEKVKIATERVDDIVNEKIDFIKIDIEGHEPSAIRGMAQIIAKYRPIILSEINEYWLRKCSSSSGKDYLMQLISLGYRVCSVNQPDKQIMPADLNLDILALVSQR